MRRPAKRQPPKDDVIGSIAARPRPMFTCTLRWRNVDQEGCTMSKDCRIWLCYLEESSAYIFKTVPPLFGSQCIMIAYFSATFDHHRRHCIWCRCLLPELIRSCPTLPCKFFLRNTTFSGSETSSWPSSWSLDQATERIIRISRTTSELWTPMTKV